MKIENIETFLVRLPVDSAGSAWKMNAMNHTLVRIDTDAGISGWGEAWGLSAAATSKAALDSLIAPMLIGRDPTDIEATNLWLQQATHVFGRYGAMLHAISGIDIALWDIAAKAAGKPLYDLLGGARRKSIPAYASLVRYAEPERVAERTRAALAEGYGAIKLHEIGVEQTAAAREAAGPKTPIMLDTNCAWNREQAHHMAEALSEFDLYWLEEPIFPPEDFAGLAALRKASTMPIAAGECASTDHEFRLMFDAGAVGFAQPDVNKVGGITEFMKVARLAESRGVAIAPHTPYFGPGFLASLHLIAVLENEAFFERFYVNPEASLFGDLCDPIAGALRVPETPGLGCDPDPDALAEYTVEKTSISKTGDALVVR